MGTKAAKAAEFDLLALPQHLRDAVEQARTDSDSRRPHQSSFHHATTRAGRPAARHALGLRACPHRAPAARGTAARIPMSRAWRIVVTTRSRRRASPRRTGGWRSWEASAPSSAYVAGRCWVFSLRRPCRGHHQHALGLLIARNSFTKLRYVRMKSCSLLYYSAPDFSGQ